MHHGVLIKVYYVAIFQATYDSAADGDDEVMKSLVELCEDVPKYVRPQVSELLSTCLKVILIFNVYLRMLMLMCC